MNLDSLSRLEVHVGSSADFVPTPVSESAGVPLVSCVMPTRNRRRFIQNSLRCFFAQDYPNLELLVVDDGSDAISDLLPNDPRIRYWHLPEKLTVGAKRNFACAQAAGEFIVHWDDDDWYPTSRVRRQITPLLQTEAQVSGSSALYYYDQEKDEAFHYQYKSSGAWVAGNTLAYRKTLWQQNPFEAIQVAEDIRFLARVPGHLIHDLCDPGLCVASIHRENVSPKITAGSFWLPEPVRNVKAILARDSASLVEPRRARDLSPVSCDKNGHSGASMQTIDDHSSVHCGYRIAREADLSLIEFSAFNHAQILPRMRRWELPWALFAAQLGNTMSVLDCTINPVNFGECLARLYPNVHYRHVSPVQGQQFRLPFGVPDESFDRVFCVNTLEHLVQRQREALVAELARKLKPGGLLLLTSDFYFDASWSDPAFLNAGVMRSDRTEFFGGWNKISARDWIVLCQANGLAPIEPGPWNDPREEDPGLFRNLAPFSHATIAGVFSKGKRPELRSKRVMLALLTWNTCDISVESVNAYVREARMIRRVGYEPYICICDNGSSDGTQDALRNLEAAIDVPCKVILNQKNIGNSVARNQIIECLMETGADYLLFMDGDIEIVPFSSFAMLRYMENCGYRLGCIGADSNGQTPMRDHASPCLFSIDAAKTEEVNLVAWTQYGMFRRSVFEQGVRFDESDSFVGPGWGFEDNDLAFQMELKEFRNQRYFGMVYLHRAARSSVQIMRQLGLDPNALYARRKQYVIDKWASVPQINNGPLALVRRIQMLL